MKHGKGNDSLKLDMDDRFDVITGFDKTLMRVLAIGLALFQIYTATIGLMGSTQQRAIHLALASALAFIIYPSFKGAFSKWFNWALAGLALLSSGYVAVNAVAISNRFSYVTPLSSLELFLGIAGVLILLETGRRMLGLSMSLVVVAFLAYAFLGQFVPGRFGHQGFTLMWIVDHLYYTPSGVFGIPLGVSSTYVAIFVIFGALLSISGGGQFFTDFASATMGRVRGGPAKIAVVASALFGMINGASSANVVTTGSITIPLMRRTGYERHFAGAVEAVASTGGEITPPVMGAAAFILSQLANIPYKVVAIAAAIPAFLYYVALYVAIDLEALRLNLKGLSAGELPDLRRVLKEGFVFIIPIAMLVYMIYVGYTPIKAGVFALFANLGLCYLRRATWIPLKRILDGLETASCNLAPVAIACGLAGVLIGVITLTDVGLKVTQLIIGVSGGNLLVALVLTMIVAIILGMGMPPSAAYIIEAVLVAPALIQMGLQPLVAHLFVFYYTVISAITPPVAVAAYAAAAIAGTNPMRVGWTALRLGLAGLIIPFMFVYSPGLLLQADTYHVVLATLTSILGVVSLAIGLAGNIRRKIGFPVRLLFLGAAGLLVSPGLITGLTGAGLFALAWLLYRNQGLMQAKKGCLTP